MNTQSTTPRCFNRPAFLPGYWLPVRTKTGKATFRWVEHRMSTDCGSWKTVHGLDDPIPVRENWNCEGCRWQPVAQRGVP